MGLGIFPGTTPQDGLAVSWLALYPHNALAYQGTAYRWAGGYNLGDTAAIGNHNVEVYGPLAGTGVNGIDADPALVIQDFLTNAQYGCGFDPAIIDAGSLFTNPDSFQAYCRAMGYAFSPALTNQEQASSILTRWLQIFSTAAVWSGGLLKFIPYGDTAISTGQEQTFSTQLSIPIPIPVSSGGSLPALVTCRVAELSSFQTVASSTPSLCRASAASRLHWRPHSERSRRIWDGLSGSHTSLVPPDQGSRSSSRTPPDPLATSRRT